MAAMQLNSRINFGSNTFAFGKGFTGRKNFYSNTKIKVCSDCFSKPPRSLYHSSKSSSVDKFISSPFFNSKVSLRAKRKESHKFGGNSCSSSKIWRDFLLRVYYKPNEKENISKPSKNSNDIKKNARETPNLKCDPFELEEINLTNSISHSDNQITYSESNGGIETVTFKDNKLNNEGTKCNKSEGDGGIETLTFNDKKLKNEGTECNGDTERHKKSDSTLSDLNSDTLPIHKKGEKNSLSLNEAFSLIHQNCNKFLNKIVSKISDQKSISNPDLMNANWTFVAETNFFEFSRLLGKYTFAVTGTGAILAVCFRLAGGTHELVSILCESWAAGITIGSIVGARQVLNRLSAATRRNVLITGSTRGLGKALAREFIRSGDSVIITSRNEQSVKQTVLDLQRECQVPVAIIYQKNENNSFDRIENVINVHDSFSFFKKRNKNMEKQTILGIACTVQESSSVKKLTDIALKEFNQIDLWLNNAGFNSEAKSFLECTDEEINNVVKTNLIGSLICTQQAMKVMKGQVKGGHVFNMDGAGYSGGPTPRYAVYGATKCALRQMQATLLEECKFDEHVGIHTISPGMVLTDLLLSGATVENKQMFNIICEQPETVARALVPKIRLVTGTGKAVDYLTPPRIVFAIVTAWLRRGRWFDEEGRAVYSAETDRLRAWAEGRRRDPISVAIEMLPSGAWISLLSSSVLCAYIILISTYGINIIPHG